MFTAGDTVQGCLYKKALITGINPVVVPFLCLENIRIKEYTEICSEMFRMTINLWRIRGFPLRKNGFFFTSEELG